MYKNTNDPPVEGHVVQNGKYASDMSHLNHNQAPPAPLGSPQQTDVVEGIPLYEEWNDPEGKRFIKTGYQDLWAGILFALIIIGTVILGIYNGVASDKKMTEQSQTLDNATSRAALKWVPWATLLSVGLAALSLAAMRAQAAAYIVIANLLAIALSGYSAYALFTEKAYLLGVFTAVGALIYLIWFILVRHRIPFAAVLLKTSSVLTTSNWGVLIVSFVGLGIALAFFVAWCSAALPTLSAFETSQDSNAYFTNALLCFGLMLILFWGIQVITNVVHVTASGTVATWFFVGGSRMPAQPTKPNLIRALTTSFGSICLGSLVVALLKLLYFIARKAIRNIDNEFAKCVLSAIVNMLEWMTRMFNVYAFTHVAIYGTDFITAAKQTWAMVQDCGCAAIFNDTLVWPVMSLTTFFAALFTGTLFGRMSDNGTVGLLCAFISMCVFTILMRPVYSGIATQFVCVAECPEVLPVANPDYLAALNGALPEGETIDTRPLAIQKAERKAQRESQIQNIV